MGSRANGGGPERCASLADVALTCFLTADKPLSVRPPAERQCVPVVVASEGSPVTQSAELGGKRHTVSNQLEKERNGEVMWVFLFPWVGSGGDGPQCWHRSCAGSGL